MYLLLFPFSLNATIFSWSKSNLLLIECHNREEPLNSWAPKTERELSDTIGLRLRVVINRLILRIEMLHGCCRTIPKTRTRFSD